MPHMNALTTATPPANAKVRIRPGKRRALRQVLELQDAAFDGVILLKGDMAKSGNPQERARLASALSALVRSWDCAEERKRILRNRPLPGSLSPGRPKTTRPRRQSILLDVEDTPEP